MYIIIINISLPRFMISVLVSLTQRPVQVQNNQYHALKKDACQLAFTDKVLLTVRCKGQS